MNTNESPGKLPKWIIKTTLFLPKIKLPVKLVYLIVSLSATLWFLFRVIPKPSRASYPCMKVAAPIISGFVIWILTLSGTVLAFKNIKHKLIETRYIAAFLFLILGISAATLFLVKTADKSKAGELEIWYKPNIPHGVAKGIYPGRVAWGHNPKIASWNGSTGYWWSDEFNNQNETDILLSQTLFSLTNKNTEKEAWNALFLHFNSTKQDLNQGYRPDEKIVIKINMNNTDAHESNNRINANPQLILSLLTSLINEGEVPQENITVTDPSRFITDNIFDKCHAVFPKVHFVDHNGGNGREKAIFIENAIPYSVDNGDVAKGIAKCMVDATYNINLALMKGHVSQGVTFCAKNFFGCTSIETDWRKNAHSSGFSQKKDGSRTYSVYPDYMGHKDLGAKTFLFLIDGIYSNKFVDGIPEFRWTLAPYNNDWPGSLFASQDGVAIESVVLDFILTEWPDAPDMIYSDFYLEEMAQPDNSPSGTIYDPERDGTKLNSLGVTEHWNNSIDKQYSRNMKTGNGIELIYTLID